MFHFILYRYILGSIISDAPNETYLQRGENEAVVVLPASVSDSKRRVSFVVFRNDKAFQNSDVHAVNSRVLSIRVDNITKFTQGEVSFSLLSILFLGYESNKIIKSYLKNK